MVTQSKLIIMSVRFLPILSVNELMTKEPRGVDNALILAVTWEKLFQSWYIILCSMENDKVHMCYRIWS